ncbi:MAG: diguanylate cyclase [Lachnospiraceae bacterium]|nr:diguanylate cyclase [Lachnospiraceae bacterium]
MKRKKILIVDDQLITLKMTTHILDTRYDIICAMSGTEAIALYKKERPDMILTDLNMPQMSGFELQNTLQEMYAEHIPIMFMTADESEEAESRGFENGAVDFIRKPFRADVLLRRVENILQNLDKIAGLKRAAETDPMTGLLNKASSQSEIGMMCRETPGTLMMIDLDSFKLVNDIYGHNMGDKILIRFAEIIQSAIRATDLAGRMGGDEFIAFCQHVKEESVIAEKTAYINEELMKSAREYMGDDMTIPLGASIGAVCVPDEGTDFLTVYQKADRALYTVKQNGKHGYAIFREAAKTKEKMPVAKTDIAREMMILGERGRGRGAYRLPEEQFALIYRFLVRMESNYHKENRLVIYRPVDERAAEKTEEFCDTVCRTLRASDVVTCREGKCVMILLMEMDNISCTLVLDRIAEMWAKNGAGYQFSHEVAVLADKE